MMLVQCWIKLFDCLQFFGRLYCSCLLVARAITIEFLLTSVIFLPFLTYPSAGRIELCCQCLFDHHYWLLFEISKSVEMGEQARGQYMISESYQVLQGHRRRKQIQRRFSTVYNILASFSDLTNPPVQYSIYVENWLYWLYHRSQEPG